MMKSPQVIAALILGICLVIASAVVAGGLSNQSDQYLVYKDHLYRFPAHVQGRVEIWNEGTLTWVPHLIGDN
jgi:hypothetical protein